MIVTEPIYDVRESHNCPRTFATHFTCIHLERRFLFSIWCYKIVCPLTKGRWYSWCSVSCPPPLVQIPLSTFLRLSKLRLQRRKAIRELGPREAMGYLAFAPSSSVWALVSRLPIERLHRLSFIRQMLRGVSLRNLSHDQKQMGYITCMHFVKKLKYVWWNLGNI